MVGDASSLMWATSVPLGVARLTAEFVHSDPISKRDRRALRDHIVDVLAPVVGRGRRRSSPSSRSGAAARSRTSPRWSRPGATRTRRRRSTSSPSPARSSSRCTRSCWPRRPPSACASTGSTPRRVDLIVAGSMVLATAMELFDFDQLTISEWALREGIVLDAVGRHDPDDWSDDPHAIRGRAVLGLARRCNWAEAHARQVANLSLELFDATAAHARPRRHRPRAARVRRAAARHRRARREQRAPQARRVPRAQRPAARLRPRRDRAARRDRALAPTRRAAGDRRVPAARRRRDRSGARARRDPARRRRPRPQPQPERVRPRRDGHAVARAAAPPHPSTTPSSRSGARAASARCSRRCSTASSSHHAPVAQVRTTDAAAATSRRVATRRLAARASPSVIPFALVLAVLVLPACGGAAAGRSGSSAPKTAPVVAGARVITVRARSYTFYATDDRRHRR